MPTLHYVHDPLCSGCYAAADTFEDKVELRDVAGTLMATITRSRLQLSSTRTVCEWKGVAFYWSFVDDGIVVDDIAWSYPSPNPAYAAIADHLAFYPQRVDACWVDDERVGAFDAGELFIADRGYNGKGELVVISRSGEIIVSDQHGRDHGPQGPRQDPHHAQTPSLFLSPGLPCRGSPCLLFCPCFMAPICPAPEFSGPMTKRPTTSCPMTNCLTSAGAMTKRSAAIALTSMDGRHVRCAASCRATLRAHPECRAPAVARSQTPPDCASPAGAGVAHGLPTLYSGARAIPCRT